MDSEIEQMVENCQPCQMEAKAPGKTNLQPWPKPSAPWQRVHIDYAGPFFGKEYLIIVDAFSKYPEVFEMATKSTAVTIEKLRYLFSRHGIPEILVSDNGTQFSSNEFAKFMAVNGVNHLFSAPYNPMSNGQAERFVDTFKRTFRKMKGERAPSKEIIKPFLVSYRTTPNDSLPNSITPAEMFLGRKPRTTLDLLRPAPTQPIDRDVEMARRFNKRFGTKLREFPIGDKFFARHRISQNWQQGKISKRTGVIYDLAFADGRSGRYHANQLRPRKTSDSDELSVMLEASDIPRPIAVEDEREIPLEDPHDEQENLVGQIDHGQQRRYSQRNRRPPQRFSS